MAANSLPLNSKQGFDTFTLGGCSGTSNIILVQLYILKYSQINLVLKYANFKTKVILNNYKIKLYFFVKIVIALFVWNF